MIHVMLDLETWGVTPGSDIRSIGACTFDPEKGVVNNFSPVGGSSQFYAATDNPPIALTTPHFSHWDDRKYPLTRDPKTVEWWSAQSAEAQAAFADPIDLAEALIAFSEWLASIGPKDEIRLWSKGPHFDISILEAAYRCVGFDAPWHYRAPRDMRTIAEAAGLTDEEIRALSVGNAHNALDDAISQAMVVCEAYYRLKPRHIVV